MHISFHSNILRFCNRPFDNAHDMNEALIDNWNSVCDKDSTVYFLGDFALKCSRHKVQSIIEKLNFKALYFIKGNHEKSFMRWYEYYLRAKFRVAGRVEMLPPLYETKIEDKDVIMCHYPLAEWNRGRYGSYMLCGHSHGNYPASNPKTSVRNILDVGVDCWDYKPVSWEQIKEFMNRERL